MAGHGLRLQPSPAARGPKQRLAPEDVPPWAQCSSAVLPLKTMSRFRGLARGATRTRSSQHFSLLSPAHASCCGSRAALSCRGRGNEADPSIPCLLPDLPSSPTLGCSCSPGTCRNEPLAVIGLHWASHLFIWVIVPPQFLSIIGDGQATALAWSTKRQA